VGSGWLRLLFEQEYDNQFIEPIGAIMSQIEELSELEEEIL